MSAVGLIVLAAGASTRMGMPKQLLQFGERSLINHVVEVAIASVCNPIIVVLGASSDRIKPEVEPLDARVVENTYWAEGMSTIDWQFTTADARVKLKRLSRTYRRLSLGNRFFN